MIEGDMGATVLSSSAVDGETRLTPDIQSHLGRLLGITYDRLTAPSEPAPARLADLLKRLSLVLAAQAHKDENAFRADFVALMPSLQRFALSLTKRAAQADDLVQDTMLKAWRFRSGYVHGTNLVAWLFTIMRNTFYSTCRKYSREVTSDDGIEDRLIAPPEQHGFLDLQDLQTALGKLSKEMREALVLVTIENLSYEDAAAAMKCRIGTVKSRVSRAREQLAMILGYNGGDVGADQFTMSAMSTGSARV